MNLTEFLLARVAEDEASARGIAAGAHEDAVSTTRLQSDHVFRWSPARVLAECEAKRRIVEEYDAADESWRTHPEPENPKRLGKWYHDMTAADFERYEAWVAAVSLRGAVERLAAVYANHPDYQEDWRP